MTDQNEHSEPRIFKSHFLTIYQILGNKKVTPPIPAIIPVSRTTWLEGVNSGIFPKPAKLGGRTNFWRVKDIQDLIDSVEIQE